MPEDISYVKLNTNVEYICPQSVSIVIGQQWELTMMSQCCLI